MIQVQGITLNRWQRGMHGAVLILLFLSHARWPHCIHAWFFAQPRDSCVVHAYSVVTLHYITLEFFILA